MSVEVRPATPADADAIAEIALAAFDESLESDAVYVASALCRDGNLVAVSDARVTGFAGSFITRSAAGARRYELDLLAVAEDARGRGIGAALVAASRAAAVALEADLIRALVAANNQPMQRLCCACGFERTSPGQALYVSSAQAGLPQRVGLTGGGEHEAHLIPVETLTYRGVWLEGALSRAALHEARGHASVADRWRIGAAIPIADAGTAGLLAEEGFERVGEFDWWRINLQSG